MAQAASSVVVASGTMVSRLLGFGRSLLLATALGVGGSQAAVAFGMANQLPNTVFALVAGGVLNSVLVPQIVRAVRRGDGSALVSKLLTLGATAALAVAVAATLCAPLLVRLYAHEQEPAGGPGGGGPMTAGLSPETMTLAITLAYWCLPQIFFYASYALMSEVMNANGRFAAYSWAPVVNNVVSIAGLVVIIVVLGPRQTEADTWGPAQAALLGGTATLGVASQLILLLAFFRRTGLTFRPDFRWRGTGLGDIGRRGVWVAGVAVIEAVKSFVQGNVASRAGTEGANIATLQNAWFIFSLPHSVIAVSITVVVFTTLSQHADRGDTASIARDVRRALGVIGVGLTLCTAFLVVLSVPIAALFEPHFDQMLGYASVIGALAICLVSYGSMYVLQRVLYAFGDTRTPFLWGLVGLVISVTLLWGASLLPPPWIIAGIGAAITVANLISCIAWIVIVRRRIGPFGLTSLAKEQALHLAAAVLAAGIGVPLAWWLGSYRPDGFALMDSWTAALVCVVVAAAMSAVYVAFLALVRDPVLAQAVAIVRRRRR